MQKGEQTGNKKELLEAESHTYKKKILTLQRKETD